MASMAHSMPLPGPSRPQVSNRAGSSRLAPARRRSVRRRRRRRRGAVWNQRHLVVVDVESVEQSRSSRLGHDHDDVGRGAHLLEHARVGSSSGRSATVCATSTIGTSISAISSTIDSPSGPSYMPYSCWTMTTSVAFSASTAAARCCRDPAVERRHHQRRPRAPATGRVERHRRSSRGDQPGRQGRRERGDPARRGRKGRQDPERSDAWLSPGVTGGTENGGVHDRTP